MLDVYRYCSKEQAEKTHGPLCWKRIEAQPDLPLCPWHKPFLLGQREEMYNVINGQGQDPAPKMVSYARVEITEEEGQ